MNMLMPLVPNHNLHLELKENGKLFSLVIVAKITFINKVFYSAAISFAETEPKLNDSNSSSVWANSPLQNVHQQSMVSFILL